MNATVPKVAPALDTAADALDHALAAKQKLVADLGLPLPPPPKPVVLPHPHEALRDLISLVEDASHDLQELISARSTMEAILKDLNIDPKIFGRSTHAEVVTLMERWARDAASRVADFTSAQLASAGRKQAFVGYLVQHLLLTHPEISPALDAAAACGAWAVLKSLEEGTALLKNADGVEVKLSLSTLEAPRRAESVEFLTDKGWKQATDAIWYCTIKDEADPGVTHGHYWSQRLELKKGHVDTEQLRTFESRAAKALSIRWVDSLTGKLIEVKRTELFVKADEHARTLMVGRLPERFGNHLIDLARTRSHGEYILYNGRLNLPEVARLYDILK
ncbi:hypothetical protein [Streptomyces pseudovenezuelae]|uniref:DNA mismatch repair protein n=1 Tax=Streptomyces pseudovenezuelae TaxID=67350 RepID=A0ABT6LYU5_9ACTN|nr:hypothetical protein [Streptomyces pseudovenezuelae]MDH6221476.1 hypothetical protein [Streptomyces pseudovenezuelae]